MGKMNFKLNKFNLEITCPGSYKVIKRKCEIWSKIRKENYLKIVIWIPIPNIIFFFILSSGD